MGVDDQPTSSEPEDNVVHATSGNDTIIVSGSSGEVYGGAGDDIIKGSLWQDDYIDAGDGNDYVDGRFGDDTIFGGAGDDSLIGWAGDDMLDGGDGNDFLDGGYNEDSLKGGAGDDVLKGGFHDDILDGGDGIDTALFTGNRNDYEIIEDGDSLIVTAIGEGAREGIDTLTDIEILDFADLTLHVSEIIEEEPEDLVGMSVDDQPISSEPEDNVVHATSGNDTIIVSGSSGEVYGGAGDDIIKGSLWQDDYIDAGDGNDYVDGRFGDDTIFGGAGDDSLIGWAGDDMLDGGDGNDFLDGGYNEDSLKGGAGDDVLKGGFHDDILDGGDGIDTALFTGNRNDYEIIEDGDSLIVTAIGEGAREGIDTLTDIEILDFADLTLHVSEIIEEESAPDGLIVAVKTPEANSANDIVGFVFENNTDSSIDIRPMTFGQVFKKGDLLPDQYLSMNIDGEPVAVQMDVKAKHHDGSVRHAVLSVEAPYLVAGESKSAILRIDDSSPSGVDIIAMNIIDAGYDVQIKITNDGNSTQTIDLADLLTAAITNGSVETWLSGPLAGEFHVETAISEHLQLKADIRMMKDGSFRTDVSIANEWALVETMDTFVYDVEIVQDGAVAFSSDDVLHHRNSTWHKQIYSDGEPAQHLVRDVDYLINSGAFNSYDTDIGIQEAAIKKYDSIYKNDDDGADFELFDFGLYERYMPSPGGRGDLGFSPLWIVNYLMSQDERAEKLMMAQADIGGHIPWYFRDSATGDAISIDEHEKLSLIYGDKLAYGTQDRPGGELNNSNDGWVVDSSHQPEVFFVPYMVSGDRYYLDGLKMQANWNLLAENHQQRGESDGIVYYGQVRGTAWALRTIGNAAWILPDDDSMKSYFNEKFTNNIDFLIDRFLGEDGHYDDAGMLEGYLEYRVANTSPWMEEFITQVFSVFAARGVEGAAEIIDWQMNYLAGRFTADDLGYTGAYGSAYKLLVSDSDGFEPRKSEDIEYYKYFTTWEELFAGNFELDGELEISVPDDQDFIGQPYYEPSGQSYTAIARGAMAAALSVNSDNADVAEAYILLVGGTEEAEYSLEATFGGINPILANGMMLRSSNIHVLNEDQQVSDDTFFGTNAHELIAGKGGNDMLYGQGGIDLLGGGEGDDTIFGGADDDYLFGNNGNDVLHGDAGDDILRGNVGADELYGGSGDDTLYADMDDTIVDGGAGFDQLVVQAWRGHDFNLTDGVITGIEIIDMRNMTNDSVNVENTIELEIKSILDISDNDDLYIYGDVGFDEVLINGNVNRLDDVDVHGDSFAHYSDFGADLFVQLSLSVNGDQII